MSKDIIIQNTDYLKFEEDSKGRLEGIITASQEIPDDHLQVLAAVRDMNKQKFRKSQDMKLAVSIPTSLADHWKRNGFDVLDRNVTTKDVIARLRKEGLEAFIVN